MVKGRSTLFTPDSFVYLVLHMKEYLKAQYEFDTFVFPYAAVRVCLYPFMTTHIANIDLCTTFLML